MRISIFATWFPGIVRILCPFSRTNQYKILKLPYNSHKQPAQKVACINVSENSFTLTDVAEVVLHTFHGFATDLNRNNFGSMPDQPFCDVIEE